MSSGSEGQRSASPSKETFSPAVRAFSGANPFERMGGVSGGGFTEHAEDEKTKNEKGEEGKMETVVEGLEGLKVGGQDGGGVRTSMIAETGSDSEASTEKGEVVE